MNAVTLTIVTITRDDPDGLARTLASCAAWRLIPGVEQIVVDGNENPRAPALETNLRHLARAPRGVSDAFNFGVEEARGEWIWFLNSDDRIDERLAPEFLLALLRQSRADVVIGGLSYGDEKDPRPHFPPAKQWPPLSPWIPHPASLVRKAIFARAGPFDPAYGIAMDYEWWLRALANETPVDVLAVPFARFALGGLSQRSGLQPQLAAEYHDAVRRHQKRFWRVSFARCGGWLKAWLKAQLARRPEKPPGSG